MEHDMRDYFDSIRASERLKRRTKARLRERTADYGRDIRRVKDRRRMLAGCVAGLAVTLAGLGMNMLTVARVSLDINPSVEMNINARGRVISMQGLNRDGAELAEGMDISGMTCGDAMQYILISDLVEPYLAGGSAISISVSGNLLQQNQTILRDVVCRAYAVADEENIAYFSADSRTAREARSCGLSAARYQALKELRKIDPDATAADVQEMSAAEINSLIDPLPLVGTCE